VRELENVIRRAMVLASGDVIQSYDLGIDEEGGQDIVASPLTVESPRLRAIVANDMVQLSDGLGRWRPWSEIQSDAFAKVYRQCGKNIAQMARQLGISRATVYRWLETQKP
jgi:transcriptional regulator of acetoin/glycerol metabolism